MDLSKFSSRLLIAATLMMVMVVTFVNASRHGEKIHFQDSSELGEFDIDVRPGHGRGNRNHRGRGRGHEIQNNAQEFEQGVPGIYPIKGPPQTPLELSSHPGRGIGLQNHIRQQHQQQQQQQQYPIQTANNLYTPTINQAAQQPLNHPYAGNPFLSKIQMVSVISPSTSSTTTTNNNYSPSYKLDKITTTTTTTTPSPYVNPRRFDLLYGSNLLEEEQEASAAANRQNKTEATTEISFDDRGLFYSDPRCPPGQILVKNKCRVTV